MFFYYAKFDVGTEIITNIKSSKAQREVAKKLGGVSAVSYTHLTLPTKLEV